MTKIWKQRPKFVDNKVTRLSSDINTYLIFRWPCVMWWIISLGHTLNTALRRTEGHTVGDNGVCGVAVQHTHTQTRTHARRTSLQGCTLHIQTSMAACSWTKELSFIHLHLILVLATASVQSSPRGHL